MIISLTGFMGCGKSSVGRRLSQLLCCPFMDLDSAIEERVGRSIPEIFANDGEAAFRQMELETLKNILEEVGRQSVLSLGGGAVMTPECAELVREKTTCIYLRASVDTLASRLASEAEGRPLLNPASQPESTDSNKSPNPAPHPKATDRSHSPRESASVLRSRIESLMSHRASTYEATAHMILDTDGLSIDEIVQTLATKIRTIR